MNDLQQKQCNFCGELFTPSRKWQEFCSDKCRNNYHNDKKYVAPIKCPNCKNDEPNTIEVLRSYKTLEAEYKSYFCNVCAKSFTMQV